MIETTLAAALQVPVSELMTTSVVCVRDDLETDSLAALLLERNISGAPVVDERGRPIGVVSKTDLVRDNHERGDTLEVDQEPVRLEAGGYRYDLGPGFHAEPRRQGTVREIMTPLTFSLSEDATVARAAALMAYEGVHRVPVVSSTGEVVGVVSSMDVLRWLANASGYGADRPRG